MTIQSTSLISMCLHNVGITDLVFENSPQLNDLKGKGPCQLVSVIKAWQDRIALYFMAAVNFAGVTE